MQMHSRGILFLVINALEQLGREHKNPLILLPMEIPYTDWLDEQRLTRQERRQPKLCYTKRKAQHGFPID